MNAQQIKELADALRPAAKDPNLYPLIQANDQTLADPRLASVRQLAGLESAVRQVADKLPVGQAVRLLAAIQPVVELQQVGVRQMVERMAAMLTMLVELNLVTDERSRREIVQLLADSRRCV